METFEKEEIEREIEKIVEPFLKEEGYILVDINWKGSGRKGKIEIFVDSPTGITSRDTEKLAEEISELLYIKSVPLDYILEVSSPGLDRVLKKKREFEWARGRIIRVIYGKGEEKRGVLFSVNEENITLLVENELFKIPFNDIKKAQLTEWEKYGKF